MRRSCASVGCSEACASANTCGGGACVAGTCARADLDAGTAGTDASMHAARTSCQSDTTCASGQRCSAVTTGATSGTLATSYCRAACASDMDCVGLSRCVRMALADGSGNADVCSIPCALGVDECASGDTCRPKSLEDVATGGYVTVLECEVFGMAPQGGACGVADDWRCIAGALCDSRTSTCVELCPGPLTGASSCPATTTCTPYSSPLFVDGTEWGVCTAS